MRQLVKTPYKSSCKTHQFDFLPYTLVQKTKYIHSMYVLLSDSLNETTYLVKLSDYNKSKIFTIGFVNVTVNLITGVIPLFALGFLNYRIYKCLLERRRQVTEIGMNMKA